MPATHESRSPLPATAALVSLLVLVLGATALFALSFTNQKSAAAVERLGHFHGAQLAAVEAQVNFKTQVQEWKDLLLRGRDPQDHADYLAKFIAREADVGAAFKRMRTELSALGYGDEAAVSPSPATAEGTSLTLDRVAALEKEHAALGARYRTELAAHDFQAPDVAFQIDRAVRGIDRPLNQAIDRLAREVEVAADREFVDFQRAADTRYAALRKVVLTLGTLAVLGAFALVFQALRSRRARPAH